MTETIMFAFCDRQQEMVALSATLQKSPFNLSQRIEVSDSNNIKQNDSDSGLLKSMVPRATIVTNGN